MRLVFTPLSTGGARGWLLLATVLLVGTTGMGVALRGFDTAPEAAPPAGSTIAATRPVLMEPPGGSIIWGITTFATTIIPNGVPRLLRDPEATGALIRVQIPTECAGGDLEVVRLAPGPHVATHRATQPTPMAYVPAGIYELTAICGRVRGPTTRLEIVSDVR